MLFTKETLKILNKRYQIWADYIVLANSSHGDMVKNLLKFPIGSLQNLSTCLINVAGKESVVTRKD